MNISRKNLLSKENSRFQTRRNEKYHTLRPNHEGMIGKNRIEWSNLVYPHGIRFLSLIRSIKWSKFKLPSPENIQIVLDSTPYSIFGGAAFALYGSVYEKVLNYNVSSTADIDVTVNIQMNRPNFIRETEISIVKDFHNFLEPIFIRLKEDIGEYFENVELVIEEEDRVRVNVTINSNGKKVTDHVIEFLMKFYYSNEPYDKLRIENEPFDNEKIYTCEAWPDNYTDEDTEGEQCRKSHTYEKVLQTIKIGNLNVSSLWTETSQTISSLLVKSHASTILDKNISRLGRIRYGIELLLTLFITKPKDILITHLDKISLEKQINSLFMCIPNEKVFGFKTKDSSIAFVDVGQIFSKIYDKYHDSEFKNRFNELVSILRKRPNCIKYIPHLKIHGGNKKK